jgi:hypothetical protein
MEISAALKGEYRIVLTLFKPIPNDWLGDVRHKQVLCLASSGEQQGLILAEAGAKVIGFDNSDEQLKWDTLVHGFSPQAQRPRHQVAEDEALS